MRDLPCLQQASYLEGGPLTWMLSLYLQDNQNYDDYDDDNDDDDDDDDDDDIEITIKLLSSDI